MQTIHTKFRSEIQMKREFGASRRACKDSINIDLKETSREDANVSSSVWGLIGFGYGIKFTTSVSSISKKNFWRNMQPTSARRWIWPAFTAWEDPSSWIQLSQDICQWRTLVNAITKFGFQERREKSWLAQQLSAYRGLCCMELI